MATQYHVYMNDGAGGEVDYGTIVATTASLTWTSSALSANTQTRFAVRAYFTGSGEEEKNVDAVVYVDLDGSQVDVSNLPDPPTQLTVRPASGGDLRVEWFAPVYPRKADAPTSFKVYVGTPTVSYASVAATVTATAGLSQYGTTLTGLIGGSTYQVVVRSVNATGTETNTTVATATADSTAPGNVDSLTATATV